MAKQQKIQVTLADQIENIMKFQTDRRLHKQNYNWENESINIIEELLEARGYDVPKNQRSWLSSISKYIRSKAATNPAISWTQETKETIVDAYADIIVFSIGAIMKLGYDPRIVLDEVQKEINSREGTMIGGKFEKNLKESAVAKWYKADFTKAKG